MSVVRYAMVGGFATLIDFGIFSFFAVYLDYHYLVIGAVSFSIATYVNYVISIRVVFKSGARFKRRDEILAVFATSAMGLTIHQVILFAMVSFVEAHLLIAKVVATGLVFFWNFGIRRYFIFS